MAQRQMHIRANAHILKTAFGLLWLSLCLPAAHAGHISGTSIGYHCINGCTLRVEFRAYRDCSSPISNISPINTLQISADSGCVLPTPIFGWINVSNVEVTPICPSIPTLCNTPGAAFNGIMEHFWVREYDFCQANCTNYTISWTSCCRNAGITTLSNPASTALYTSTTFNPFLTPCNSTPSFSNPPVAFICQGQSNVFNQGATDADGDSLSYTIGPCRRSAIGGVFYVNWANPGLPLTNDWIVSLDSVTGALSISPNPNGLSPGSIQVAVICIYVTEWRNGVAINTIERDMQVTVIPCAPNDHPQVLPPPTTAGGSNIDFHFETCLGATLCANFQVQDLDANQIQTMWWDQVLAPLGATFVSPLNFNVTDTVAGQNPSARFCWTPTQTGNFSFEITVRDNACPIYGENQYTVTIHVGQISTEADSVVSGCHAVSLCAAPFSGTAPFHYNWSGGGGLSTNPNRADSCLFHTYPNQGNFPFLLQISDAWGCTATYSDTISIFNNVVANAGPDMGTCANQPIVIGGAPSLNPDVVYFWSPNLPLNNNQLAQPTVTLPNPGANPLVVPFVVLNADTATSCTDLDTMLVTIYPIPASPFFLPDSACVNSAVTTIYTGSFGPTATYQWNYSGGLPPTHTGMGPHQTYFTSPGRYDVNLTVTANGCSSPVEHDTIMILPRPVAQINPVAGQCLVNNSFQFSAQGAYSPNAQYSWTFWPNASISSSTLPTPPPVVFATAGPKRVTLQISENGCPGNTDTLNFTVYPTPNPNWMVIGGVQCFNGNNYQFQTTGVNSAFASHSWTFEDGSPANALGTSPVVSFGSPGMKTVTLTVSDFGCTATRIDSIPVFPEPLASAGPDMAFCQGDGGATLLGSALGGTSPFYYNWTCGAPICGLDSIHDNDPLANPGQNTWYYLQVVDINGCESPLDSVFVTVQPKPIVDAGPDHYICGDSAPCQVLQPFVSNSPGPFSYQWLPADGLNSPTLFYPCARPDTTTIYTLVATDLSSGCSSDFTTVDTLASTTVHVHPVPIADAGPDRDICPGDSVVLAAMAFGAGPHYSFQWSPNTGLSSATSAAVLASPASSFHYSLTVWSNNCPSYADTVIVNVHTTPSVDAGWDREICLGDSALLDASAAGDSTASYVFSWLQPIGLSNPNIEDPIADPVSTTMYFVMAISSWGCESATDSVMVHLRPTPVADAGANALVCGDEPTQLQGSYSFTTTAPAPANEIQFAWTPALFLDDSVLAMPMAQPQSSGWYHLQVTHGQCTTQDSTYIAFVPELNAQASADTNIICEGDAVYLQGTGGLSSPSFQWLPALDLENPFAANTLARPGLSCSYQLVVSEGGCSDTTLIHLKVLPRPDAAFAHSSLEGCAPLSVNFLNNSSPAGFVWWDFGDGSPVSNQSSTVHTYNSPGTYPVILNVADTGHCKNQTDPVVVTVYAPPSLALNTLPEAPAQLFLPEATIFFQQTGSNILQTFWDFGDGIRAEGQQLSHTYLEEGSYLVRVHGVNPEGCTTESILGPFMVMAPELFIPNVFSPNGDGISDLFMVDYSGAQPFLLEIHDRWGSKLYSGNNKTMGWDGNTATGGKAAEGTYYYHVTVGAKEYSGSLSLLR